MAQGRDDRGRFKAADMAEEAAKAGKSVDSMASAAARASVSVDALAKAMQKLRVAKENAAAMEAAREAMGMMTNAAKAAAREQEKFNKQQEKLAKKNADAAEKVNTFESILAGLGGAFALITVAVGAYAGALWEITKAAYEVIDQREDWITLFDAIGKGPNAGQRTLDTIDALAKELPFATAKIADWAKSLTAAGVKAEELQDAVKAVAAATALMGEQGGAAAEKMIKQLAEGGEAASKMLKAIQAGGPKAAKLLAEMGLKTEDLAAAMGMSVDQFNKANISADQMRKAIEKALQAKGAGALENMMADMPVILMKVREGFMSLFEKLGGPMGKLMKQVQLFFKEFYKGSGTMKFLQGAVTKVLTVVFDIMAKLIKIGREVFKASLPDIKKMVNGLMPVIAMIKEVFKDANTLKGLKAVFSFIASAVLLFVRGLVELVKWILMGVAAGAAFIGWIGNLGSSISGAAGAVSDFVSNAIATLMGLPEAAMQMGSDLISGLIGRITSGAGEFAAAMANMASNGLAAFKSILGIASPSKVMAKMGGHVAEGTSQGIDKGAGKVQDSAAELGAGVAGGAAKGMSGGAAGGKAGAGITIHGGVQLIVGNAGQSAGQWAEEAFAAFMERLAGSQGLPAGATT